MRYISCHRKPFGALALDDITTTIAAEIVAAYVSNNSVAAADLAQLIGDVHAALTRLGNPVAAVVEEKLQPAVS